MDHCVVCTKVHEFDLHQIDFCRIADLSRVRDEGANTVFKVEQGARNLLCDALSDLIP